MSVLRSVASAVEARLFAAPAISVPIISNGRLVMAKVEPFDWRPTAASRLRWLQAHYPESVIERDRLKPEVNP